MRTIIHVFLALVLGVGLTAQNLEVIGKARVTEMDTVMENAIVVRLPDGTLAVRPAFTLPDASSTNELQLLSINGDTIFIENGNFIVVPGLGIIASRSVQDWLDIGENPLHLFNNGIPADSLYGKTYAGGLIFYLDTLDIYPFDGIVAALGDQDHNGDFTRPWGCSDTLIGTSTDLGTGQMNTDSIMLNGCIADGDAAELADSLDDGTYSDWFLPSKDELERMFDNIGKGAPSPNTNVGGFANDYYWSSSESESTQANARSFSNGGGASGSKTIHFRVRAARYFY